MVVTSKKPWLNDRGWTTWSKSFTMTDLNLGWFFTATPLQRYFLQPNFYINIPWPNPTQVFHSHVFTQPWSTQGRSTSTMVFIGTSTQVFPRHWWNFDWIFLWTFHAWHGMPWCTKVFQKAIPACVCAEYWVGLAHRINIERRPIYFWNRLVYNTWFFSTIFEEPVEYGVDYWFKY